MIAKTPTPPYYAVIFTSLKTEVENGYAEMSDKMMELAKDQSGFLGVESSREQIGITVSYWKDLESIQKWRDNPEHHVAQRKGKEAWYRQFTTRIAKVERDYNFENK
jgi:heme-degrading monooxygenase HmoA